MESYKIWMESYRYLMNFDEILKFGWNPITKDKRKSRFPDNNGAWFPNTLI